MNSHVCQMCGELLTISAGRGRPPAYCGGACRNQARNVRERNERATATPFVKLTCWTCHGPIQTGQLRRGRKFCNTACNDNYKGIRTSYKKGPKARDMVWPYGESADPLVEAVNEAIPRDLPEQIRSEACQELALAILAGECAITQAKDRAVEYISEARRGYQFSSRNLSLELPPPGAENQIPLKDRLDDRSPMKWVKVA